MTVAQSGAPSDVGGPDLSASAVAWDVVRTIILM